MKLLSPFTWDYGSRTTMAVIPHTVSRAAKSISSIVCLLSAINLPVFAQSSASAERDYANARSKMTKAEGIANGEASQLANWFVSNNGIHTDCTSVQASYPSRFTEIQIIRQADRDYLQKARRASVKRFLKYHKKDDPQGDTIRLKSWSDVLGYLRSGNYEYNVCSVDALGTPPSPQHVPYLYLGSRPTKITFTSEVYGTSEMRPTGGAEFTRRSDYGGLQYSGESKAKYFADGSKTINVNRAIYIEILNHRESEEWVKYHTADVWNRFKSQDGLSRIARDCNSQVNNNGLGLYNYPGQLYLEVCLDRFPSLVDKVIEHEIGKIY